MSCVSSLTTIGIGSSFAVWFRGAADEDGNYINDGTCTWYLEDDDGDTIATGDMEYVTSSNGNYRGVIAGSITDGLENLGFYFVKSVFDGGTDEDAVRRLSCQAKYQ